MRWEAIGLISVTFVAYFELMLYVQEFSFVPHIKQIVSIIKGEVYFGNHTEHIKTVRDEKSSEIFIFKTGGTCSNQ